MNAALVDAAEAAYDLDVPAHEWLPKLLEKGGPLFDRGLGCAAAIWAGRSRGRQPLVAQVCVLAGHPDLGVSFARAAQAVGTRLPRTPAVARGTQTASRVNARAPSILRAFEHEVGCRDVLGVWALDPRLHGIGINVPSPDYVSLNRRERRQLRTLSFHIAAGHRLRRKLGRADGIETIPVSELLRDPDHMIDRRGPSTTDAREATPYEEHTVWFRDMVMRRDRTRRRRAAGSEEDALAAWDDLLAGRHSLVDRFDAEGRRFVVAVPNPPEAQDPRGLTTRERQIVALAARGETCERISRELVVSRQLVSRLLTSSMRKLGVRTHAGLVSKLKAFYLHPPDANGRP